MINTNEQTELDVYLKQYESILGIIKFEPDCTQSRRLFEAGIAYQGAYRKIKKDTTPLSREELEGVLKEAGWSKHKHINLYAHKNHTGEIGIEDYANGPVLSFAYYSIPLSAVTRQTLRACGVIK